MFIFLTHFYIPYIILGKYLCILSNMHLGGISKKFMLNRIQQKHEVRKYFNCLMVWVWKTETGLSGWEGFLLTRSFLQKDSEWPGETELPQSTESHGSKQTGMANTYTETNTQCLWNSKDNIWLMRTMKLKIGQYNTFIYSYRYSQMLMMWTVRLKYWEKTAKNIWLKIREQWPLIFQKNTVKHTVLQWCTWE